jgi:hypothetical protein
LACANWLFNKVEAASRRFSSVKLFGKSGETPLALFFSQVDSGSHAQATGFCYDCPFDLRHIPN